MNKYILGSILFVLACLTGCDDSNDPFEGTDNFITSFTLKQGDQSLVASFRGDTIVMNIPEEVILSDVKAQVVCSENATIKPDPATVYNWEEEMFFTVTSLSGQSRKYLYTPRRSSVPETGIILLNTQEELDAFGAKGISYLDGSLIIGQQLGTDSIKSLAALSTLKQVSGSITINTRYRGHEFAGLENLEEIGGSFQIISADSLWTVDLNKLTRIGGDLDIKSAAVGDISCSSLKSVGGNLSMEAPFVSTEFSALQQVSGNLSLKGKSSVEKMSFQSLKHVGGSIEVSMSAIRLDFSELLSCKDLNVTGKTLLLLYCPKLQDISGKLSIADNPLYEVSFPALTHLGELSLSCPKVNQMNMPLLKAIDGNASISIAGFNPEQLASLESIGGTLSLTATGSVKMPAKLKKVGKISLGSGMSEIDLRGVEMEELLLQGSDMSTTVVKGDDVFAGSIVMSGLSPQFQGFKEIGSLKLNYLSNNGGTTNIAGINKITGDFSYWNNSNIQEIIMPDLQEVGGIFDLYSNIEEFHFPELKTIGGDTRICVNTTDERSFPKLEKVGGNLLIQTGYEQYGNVYEPVLYYPLLKTVGGTLYLRPYGYNETQNMQNTKLTDLNFLVSLESIGGFKIVNHKALASYEGLKKAIKSCPETNWIVEDNLYNPTYKQLAEDGLWTLPAEEE